jgi:hypothetical protein
LSVYLSKADSLRGIWRKDWGYQVDEQLRLRTAKTSAGESKMENREIK